MPKTTLTINDVTDIRHARDILTEHTPTRHKLRKICTHCHRRWRKHGCTPHLWATDYLSQYSRILIPDRPERPPHRHRPTYIKRLNRAKTELELAKKHIRQSVRAHVPTRPLPHPV